MTLTLTDQNFEGEIQNAEKPVLVDFWAKWCFPCSVLAQILDKLVKDFEGKIIFVKVNIDEAPIISQKYGIDRIPQILLFQNGEAKSGFIGVQPEDIIKRWLEENLQ
jgi:thioredoxin 1